MSIECQYFDDAAAAFHFIDNLALVKRDFIFRGHTKECYKLTTTLNRHRKVPHEAWSSDIDEIINKFRVGLTKLEIPPLESDRRIDWLEYARHHGVPTPILDFSYSPYIALFFAFNGVRKNLGSIEKEYSVIYALNIRQMAWIWATLFLNPKDKYDEAMERRHSFLYPAIDLFKDGFPDHWMQFIPSPGKHNFRMHRQQGTFLLDTLNYDDLNTKTLEELIEKHKEPKIHLRNGEVEKAESTLYKIFINRECATYCFAKLELMGINSGFLYMNADGVAQDVINSYNFNSKAGYLKDVRFPPPDDTKI